MIMKSVVPQIPSLRTRLSPSSIHTSQVILILHQNHKQNAETL